ncbi:MAG TPA: GntR family transcriptional regulator [Acidimicrobiales bacterium]|nr:GntR family transcriptional regulator [Acidimicrobiales bacterium]
MDTGANTVLYTVDRDMDAVPAVVSLATDTYESLKRAIVVGHYRLGARLGEERLARDYGVSRTPVREALVRLHVDGLVTRHPDGGWTPTVPNLAVVRELYEVRIALEIGALRGPRRSGRTHDRRLLDDLRREWQELADDPPPSDPVFVLSDEAFHLRLAEAAGNRELAELLRRVNERIRAVRMRDFVTLERMSRTIDEHLSITDAVINGDIDRACESFEQHLGKSLAVVEQRVAQAVLAMAVEQ